MRIEGTRHPITSDKQRVDSSILKVNHKMTNRIRSLNAEEMNNIQLKEMREKGKIKVLIIEEGKCSAFDLPEHGETAIVTSRSKGYKVKFNEEFLL